MIVFSCSLFNQMKNLGTLRKVTTRVSIIAAFTDVDRDLFRCDARNCGVTRKITAQVGTTDAFTDQNRDYRTHHDSIFMLFIYRPNDIFCCLYNRLSVKTRLELAQLLHLPTKTEITGHIMTVFSCCLSNRMKFFCTVRKAKPKNESVRLLHLAQLLHLPTKTEMTGNIMTVFS